LLPYGRIIYTGLMGSAKKQSQPEKRTPQAADVTSAIDIRFYEEYNITFSVDVKPKMCYNIKKPEGREL